MAGETYYRLYCDYCGYNRMTDGGDCKGLVEYKRSPIQRIIPTLDPVTKKVLTKDPVHLPKQYKCPGCGRLIRPRKLTQVLDGNTASKSERDQTGALGPPIQGQTSAYPEGGHSEI